MVEPKLAVQLAPHNKRGLMLANPVMTAAGTFGYGVELADVFDVQRLGAIVCKGTTLRPRRGNPPPRLAETPSGMLNAIGLQNVGVQRVIDHYAPIWAMWRVPVVVNIAGESVADYATLARLLDGVDGVAGVEVNISCPNVAQGGMEFGADPKTAATVVAAVRVATTLPLLVKLTPNVTDIVAIAQAVVAAGADALTVANTLTGMAIDIAARRPLLGNGRGGLSGPAVKPVALYNVYRVAAAVAVPVVGCGGIASANDALEFIMAGATAVQVGTATFVNPAAALAVVDGVAAYLSREGVDDVAELVGVAGPRPAMVRR